MFSTAIEVCGWLGALTVAAAYLLFSIHRIPNGYLFQTANLVGAGAMIINSIYHSAWPSAITSIIWCGIAGWALARLKQQHRGTRKAPFQPAVLGDEFVPPPGPVVSSEEIPGQGYAVEHG
ncbi:CBU_0592 family membrane protein [Arthrobacter wenxiniae]|jgi:hypothetical protein|uniref:CBU-0592-like domain-containing protein n=1 Tax=Arthrobacter wenxiniae TaxID=2713570 RepID=A0A7Y7IHP5_9MICC|nr:hypothetical protein [Arthrobacter wenxiniae]NVM95676.1 hypothetical protein [Arthrobacter wenxiniae]